MSQTLSIQELQSFSQQQLIETTQKSFDEINVRRITQLKCLMKPPQVCQIICNLLTLLYDPKTPQNNLNWTRFRQVTSSKGQQAILQKILDPNHKPQKKDIERIRNYIHTNNLNDPEFQKTVPRVSIAAVDLMKFGLYAYVVLHKKTL